MRFARGRKVFLPLCRAVRRGGRATRGIKWNLFGITTHEKFELDGGHTHFLEGRMDASFGTNPLAMSKAIRLMQKGLVDTGKIISHHFPLREIHAGIEVMSSKQHNKVMIHP